MAGLPKSIIKKYGISKKAWSVYRGRKGKRKRASPTKRKVKNLARRKRRYYPRRRTRRSRKMKLPLAAIAAVALPAGKVLTRQGGHGQPLHELMQGDWKNGSQALMDNLAHYFAGAGLAEWLPYSIAALLVHKFVGGEPLNLNRTLGAAGVPIVRI